MRPINREELLWDLSTLDTAGGEVAPIDHLLIRYRQGDLEEDQEREVERLLASDARARTRLAELAAAGSLQPPAELRQSIVGLAEIKETHRWQRSAVLAFAATALLALGALLNSTLTRQSYPIGSEVAFEVEFTSGHGETRGRALDIAPEPDSATLQPEQIYEFYPTDPIRLELRPSTDIDQDLDLEFGIYLQVGNRMQRIDDGLKIEHQGVGAKLSILAGDLLGTTPGEFEIYPVVGSKCLPKSVSLADRTAREALADGDQRLVMPQTVRLVPVQAAPVSELSGDS